MKAIKRKGMTLIEIIISIAILGIISIVFLNVFTSGYMGIISGGRHTESGYEVQRGTENSLLKIDISGDGLQKTTKLDETISIEFGSKVIDVKGEVRIINFKNDRYEAEATVFIPSE